MSFQKALFFSAMFILIIAMSKTTFVPPSLPSERGAIDGNMGSWRLPETLLSRFLREKLSPKDQRTTKDTSAPLAPNHLYFPDTPSSQLPSSIQAIRKTLIRKAIDDNNGDLLLFNSPPFQVTYISGLDMFLVFIHGESVDRAKRDAQSWFAESGLTQTDLCDLPVRFLLTTFELRTAHPAFTSLPDGCANDALQ